MKHLFSWSYRFPVAVISFLILVTLLALTQIPKLQIDSSLDKLMISGDPELGFYDKSVEAFGSDIMTAIYIKGDKLFEPKTLEIIQNTIYELEKVKEVKKVESLFNSPHFRSDEGYLKTSPLFDYIPDNKEEIEELIESGMNNPLIKGVLLSENKNAMSIFVYAENINHDSHFNDVFSEHISNAIKPLENVVDTHFQLGSPYIHHIIGTNIISDQFVLLPLAIIVVVVFMYIGIGSLNAAIIPISTASISLLWTLGFMAYFGLTGDMINSTIPLLIFILGCTEDTHIISEYLDAQDHGYKKLSAINYVTKKIGVAIVLTVTTTIFSYASLSVNKIIILKEFGIVASVAMFLNFIVTFTFIPVYLRFFGEAKKDKKVVKRNHFASQVDHFLEKIAILVYNVSLTKKKYTLTGIILFIGVCVYYAKNVKAENDPLSNFKASSFIRKNSDTFNQSFPGITNFYIHFTKPDEQGPFKKPENLKKIFEIYQLIEKEKIFDSAKSFADLIALVNREMTDGSQENFRVPDDGDLISQYMLFFTRDDLEKYITSDFSEANIVVNHHLNKTTIQLEEIARLKEKIAQILAGTTIEFKLTGKSILTANAAMTIVSAQIQSLELLVLIIFILMYIVFRSFKIAILSLVPNFFPVVGFFGILGFFDLPLNIGTSIIAVIALGIVIDDTIHFFVRFNENMRELQDQKEAIRETIKNEIRPITITSFALAIGLSITVFSEFVPIIALGTLTALVILLALVADLVLTPKLLMLANIQRTTSIFEYLSTQIKDEFTQKSSLFAGVEKKDIRELILSAQVFDEQSGRNLTINMKEEFIYIVLEGRVKLVGRERRSNDSSKHDLFEFGIGDQFSSRISGPFYKNTEEQLPEIELGPHSKLAAINHKFLERMDERYPDVMNLVKDNLARLNYSLI